ncbi:gp53-like domain-containing protein [Enterobacter hormaechei]
MSGSISGVSLLAADSRKSLITDVQFYEAYTSTALNRKFKNIIKPGIYSGFNVVPGNGLKVTVTSGNEGGAASVDIDNVQLSVQQILDIDVDIPAGQTTIIALQAFYKFGVKTSQVTDESTVNAAEIVTITAQQLKEGQIELCRVAVPEGATQITSEMIDTSFRVFRSLGLQLSAELDSEEEGVAANSLAIKKAISFLSGEGVPEALSTLAQLAAAINNDGNFAQTIDKALDLKAPLTSPTLTGTPKAPTAAQTVNDTQIATTAFVKAAISALVGGSTPEGLDTLSELAAALNNDPQFATTMKKALEGKQPLNQTLTDLSGKTVAGILEYLGLGEAAKRSIGNGANQVPDMVFFKSQIGSNGYACSPSGYILQWGLLTGGNQYDFNFPISFPTGGFILIGMAHTTDTAGVTALSIVNGFIRGNSAGYLASANIVNGAPQYFARSIQWFALGK